MRSRLFQENHSFRLDDSDSLQSIDIHSRGDRATQSIRSIPGEFVAASTHILVGDPPDQAATYIVDPKFCMSGLSEVNTIDVRGLNGLGRF